MNRTRPIALITGGTRGLGKSMAQHLVRRGVDVIVASRTDPKEAAGLVKELEAGGAKALALQLDAGNVGSFDAFATTIKQAMPKHFGRERFDYLINNAGVGAYAPVAETTEAQFDQLLNVHFKGPFFLTQKLLPLMVDGGRVLNVSSGLARFTYPGYGAYAAMKGAMEVLTRYQAKELGARKITVNIVAPGAIETDFGGGHVRDNAELNKFIASQTPLGRVGLPDDIGGAVALLLAPESGWINGQRIEIAGGQGI